MKIINFTPLAFSLLATSSAMTRGAVKKAVVVERRLDFERLGLGYEPGSAVTDQAAIDLDQVSIEGAVDIGSDESFQNAKNIYLNGGHSKSFASIELSSPLTANIGKGTPITGVNANGIAVYGNAYSNFSFGQEVIQVQYKTLDIQARYVDCQVGALNLVGEENTRGCLAPSGQMTIEGAGNYNYSYDVLEDNQNGRTIAGFSTAARSQMYENCPGCPYPEYKKFYDYYGVFDYGNEWVISALEGRRTSFVNGNADFGNYTFTGRAEAAKKGTAYLNIFMYVLRKFYNTISDCQTGCVNCNDDLVHAWDEGVAFYTGSTESILLYNVANKRCENYRTCGPDGIALEGIAKLNYDIFTEFSSGQYNLLTGNCNALKDNTQRIAQLMVIPLIQGTLRYAYKVEHYKGQEKPKSEGAAFAAAVLPILHDCDPKAAQIVYDNMRVGANNTSYLAVKAAFEDNYQCMGISCGDIGGLYNQPLGEYFEDAHACEERVVEVASAPAVDSDILAALVAVPLGAIAVLAMSCIFYMMNREKAGNPVFLPSKVASNAQYS